MADLKEEFGKTHEPSNVTYIEPNYIGAKEGVEIAPDLSDYCIALNIETEIFSRTEMSEKKGDASKTYIMTWRNVGDGKESRIGFLEGTKIYKNSDRRGPTDSYVNSLTTNYTDVFFTDIHEVPSSELFGIKNVEISYEKFQIPQITVTFTDVRGMALFQPSAMRRERAMDGIQGFSESDPVTSFFQAFFTMPLPKFTFYIKGFYGEPICYEMMCQDFRTNFDASSGSFDVTVKFIGYLYSFLGDVSFNALLAAPYSDYLGRSYWEQEVNSGRFRLYNPKKNTWVQMPTIMQIYTDYLTMAEKMNGAYGGTTENAEEETHEEEISNLNHLKAKYETWYENVIQSMDESAVAVEHDENGNYRRVMFVISTDKETLGEALQVNDVVVQAGKELNEAIRAHDEGRDGISENLSAYKAVPDVYTAEYAQGEATRTSTDQGISISAKLDSSKVTINESHQYGSLFKQYVAKAKDADALRTKLATEQPKVFVIDVSYSDLDEKKKKLEADAKSKKPTAEEINQQIVDNLPWEPTLENFTRVVVAHFETLMHMMYQTVRTIMTEDRKLASLGMGVDNVADANLTSSQSIVPPFPRCVKQETDNDNGYPYTKTRDVWIRAFGGGAVGFREADLVEGLLSGADTVISMIQRAKQETSNNGTAEATPINPLEIIPFPVTPYDCFSSTNPYFGSDTTNTMVGFVGKVVTRMATIFNVAWKDWVNKNTSALPTLIQEVGRMEAKNFVKAHPNIPSLLKEFVVNESNIDTFVNGILSIAKADKTNDFAKQYIDANNGVLPWMTPNEKEPTPLINKKGVLTAFESITDTDVTYVYPSESFSFGSLTSTVVPALNNGDVFDSNTFMYSHNPRKLTLERYLKYSSLINEQAFLIEDDYLKVRDLVTAAQQNGLGENIVGHLFRGAYLANEGEIGTLAEYQNLFCLTAENYEEKYSFHRKADPETTLYELPEKRGIGLYKDSSGHDRPRYPQGTAAAFEDYFSAITFADPSRQYFADRYGILQIFSVVQREKSGQAVVETISDRDEWGSVSVNKTDVKPTTKRIQFTLGSPRDFYKAESKNAILFGRLNKTTSKAPLLITPGALGHDKTASVISILLGIKGINYSEVIKQLKTSKHVFTYVPKLAVLQLGILAMVYDLCPVKVDSKEEYGAIDKAVKKAKGIYCEYIPIEAYGSGFEDILKYFYNLEQTRRQTVMYRLVRYFNDWKEKNMAKVCEMFAESNNEPRNKSVMNTVVNVAEVTQREKAKKVSEGGLVETSSNMNSSVGAITVTTDNSSVLEQARKTLAKGAPSKSYYIREKSPDIAAFSQDLMVPVLIVQGCKETNSGLSDAGVKSYLTNFLTQLKEEYKTAHHDEIAVQRAQENLNETDDTRIALYNYLKALYDKWIPSNSFDEWKLENFFTENYENDHGHAFYFIDNYYAKAGFLPINMKTLAQKIDQMFGQNNYQATLISFLVDLYGTSRCQFLSVQNFIDMTDSNKMKRMFQPIPYLQMNKPKKFPDFIVLYCYEPDKTVVVENGEYKSTSFMLNDINDIPVAITSRQPKDGFKIPAFGVSYGKQYQSYFKNVNVSMDNPIVTEQSLKLKYSIIDPKAAESANGVRTYGQDLFDVYSNMSFTCNVEMMGCAWVQPLMYFVLLNIPMFRGSYIIQKVTHSIRPGNMTTKFVGVRMANVASRITRDVVNHGGREGQLQTEAAQVRLADINNDCPYQVFSVEQAHGRDLSAVLNQRVQELACYQKGNEKYDKIAKMTWGECAARMCIQEDNQHGEFGWAMQALTLYNRYSFGLNPQCDIFLAKPKQYAQATWNAVQGEIASQQNVQQALNVVRQVWADPTNVMAYFKAYNGKDKLVKNGSAHQLTTAELEKVYFADGNAHGPLLCQMGITKYCYSEGSLKGKWKASEKKTTENKIAEGFFNAIQMSLNASPNVACTLEKTIDPNNKYHLTIREKGKKTSGNDGKLGKAYDVILNADQSDAYMSYVSSITWVTSDYGHNNPSEIDLILCEKGDKKAIKKKIGLSCNGSDATAFPSNLNDNLKLSLAKKFGKTPTTNKLFNSDVLFSAGCNDEYFNTDIINCSTLLNPPSSNGTWEDPKYVDALRDKGFDLEKAVNALTYYAGHPSEYGDSEDFRPHDPFTTESQGACGMHVCAAVNGGFGAKMTDIRKQRYGKKGGLYYIHIMKARPGWTEVAAGKTNSKGIATAPNYTERDGDITCFVVPNQNGHVHIRLKGMWVSDFATQLNKRNSNPGTEFHIIRYVGK